MTLIQTSHPHDTPLQPDEVAIERHLLCLANPAVEAHPDMRFEIAWGKPDEGPRHARTFGLTEVADAVSLASRLNCRGHNIYVGTTLKRPGAAKSKRTSAADAALATYILVDIDRNAIQTMRAVDVYARPGLLVLTGTRPEPRGQVWIRITPTADMIALEAVQSRILHACGADLNAGGAARLARLAGTISFPAAAKQARGYLVELTVPHFIPTAIGHDLTQLAGRLPLVSSNPQVLNEPAERSGGTSAANVLTVPPRPAPSFEEMAAALRHMADRDAFPHRNAIEYDVEGRITAVP